MDLDSLEAHDYEDKSCFKTNNCNSSLKMNFNKSADASEKPVQLG